MINMDFSQRVVIDTRQQPWQASPHEGVWRKPLAREDAERGHATSIVRYDAGANFTAHGHPLGEEILVLDGTFSTKVGISRRAAILGIPKAIAMRLIANGCVLLVKLHQFRNDDHQHINIDTNSADWYVGCGNLKVMPLHDFAGESTSLVHWPAGEQFRPHVHAGGEEIYVLRGELVDEHGRYPEGSWIRNPDMSGHNP